MKRNSSPLCLAGQAQTIAQALVLLRRRIYLLAKLGAATVALTALPMHAATQLQFNASSTSALENGPAINVSVDRTGSLDGNVSVDFASSDDTAKAGEDYGALSGRLTFNPGETQRTFTVRLINDGLRESTERFTITLSNPTDGAVLGTRKTLAIGIIDNDPGFSFSQSVYNINEIPGEVRLTVYRGTDNPSPVSVDFATRDGTAIAGKDYAATSNTLTFGPLESSKTIAIPILRDGLVESQEGFQVVLSNPSLGARLDSRNRATILITSDDTGIQFNSSTYTARENAGQAHLTVVRGNDTSDRVSVEFATVDDTAKAGIDYVPTSGIVKFTRSERTKTIVVPLLNNDRLDGSRQLRLELKNPAGGADLGTRSTAALAIQDNETGVQLSHKRYSVFEAEGAARVTVLRGDDGNLPVSVDYMTADGTAIAGVHYQTRSGTLKFIAGEVSKTLLIPISNDGHPGINRTFTVSLSNAVGTIGLGPTQSAEVIIIDNDKGLAFSQSSYVVSETGRSVQITVIRKDDGASSISVDYATHDASGQTPRTHVPQSGTLTFAAGEMTRTIGIQILNNSIANGDSIVQLTLSNPTGGATLGSPSAATLSIVEDDRAVVLDKSFDVGNGTDIWVSCLSVMPDGRIFIGGQFRSINGVGRTGIARLLPDGSVDPTFNPNDGRGGIDQGVTCFSMQTDGSILIGGYFSSINGIPRNRIAKLKPDGTLDDTFVPGEMVGSVESLAVQPDGKIIIGGSFDRVAGVKRINLARLNSNGSLDAEFLPPSNNDGAVADIAIQGDNAILVAGHFQHVSGGTRRALIRLNPNGTLDEPYKPSFGGQFGNPSPVYLTGLALDPTGNAIVSGTFITVDGIRRRGLARLDSNGTLDPTFDPQQGTDQEFGSPDRVFIQPNGQILVGGTSMIFHGVRRRGVARLNVDGTLDGAFNPGIGVDGSISAMGVQTDGNVVIGGSFGSVDGFAAFNVARILNKPSSLQVVQFVTTHVFITEGEGAVKLLIERIGDPAGEITVDYTVGGGTATPGVDYLLQHGTVRFRAGETTNEISISILDDGLLESTELLEVTLSNPSSFGVELTSRKSAVIEIRDNELPNLIDWSFDASAIGAGGRLASALLPDGKVILVGCPITVDGTLRGPLIRLTADGSFDPSFVSPFSQDDGSCLQRVLVLPDGKILVAGEFYLSAPGGDRNGLMRLNADGSLDTGFLAWPGTDYAQNDRLAAAANGMILVGNGGDLIRLKGDGSLDKTLLGFPIRGYAQVFAVQQDEKVIAAGSFSADEPPYGPYGLVRLNPDGSPDAQLNENAKAASNWESVQSLVAQPDGKILIGGNFQTSGAIPHSGIARLNADGTLDTAFTFGINVEYRTPDSAPSPGSVEYTSLQTDGKILIGGRFNSVNGVPRQNAVRLNADGSVDRGFNTGDLVTPWWDSPVPTLVPYSTGQILITGYLSGLDGQRFPGVARLYGDSTLPALQFEFQRFVASENQGTAEIRVHRLGNVDKPATVEFQTASGTAMDGADFSTTTGTLTFAPMEVIKTFRIALLDDGDDEKDKTVQLTLKNPSTNSGLGLAKAVLTILDDERPGSPGPTFKPGFKADEYGSYGAIDLATVESDGKILIFGQFTLPDGQPRTFARLNPDGTLDSGFKPLQNHYSGTLIVQPNGKVITRSPSNLVRLMADGSIDPSFSLAPGVIASTVPGTALDSSGRIFALSLRFGAGSDPEYYYTVIRLLPDGTVDPSFDDARTTVYGYFGGLVAQADGGVLIWGNWGSTPNNWATWKSKLIRLNPDGSEDVSFRPSIPSNGWYIRNLVLESDGTILIAGSIWINSTTQKSVVRLFADGSVDSGFETGSLGDVNSMAVQRDGKILVGGILSGIDPISPPTLVRLHSDGKVDTTFDPGTGLSRLTGWGGNRPDLNNMQLFILSDGKALVTGGFTRVNELVLPMIARVNGDFEVRITDLQLLETGVVRLTFTSRKGKTYVFQTSDDLTHWTPLGTTTASGNVLQMEDTPMAGQRQRYYRVVHGN